MFKNREEAGESLASRLSEYRKIRNLIVLAIPRGGVVVGRKLAEALKAPLDVLITRKIGAPGNPELAIGAVGPSTGSGQGPVRIIDWDLAGRVGADKDYLESKIENLKLEIKEREGKFRAGKKTLEVAGKTVILTDDGIATGATIEAGIAWLKSQKVKKIILAVPVAPPEVVEKLRPLVDEFVCLDQPEFFAAVGQFYQEFPQVSDETVIKILRN